MTGDYSIGCTQIRAHAEPWNRQIGLHLFMTRPGGHERGFQAWRATGFELEEITAENEVSECEPFARLSEGDAQGLMNSLWEAGVRPSSSVGSTGQLEAMREHLADMRRLVFEDKVETKIELAADPYGAANTLDL